MIKAKGYQGTRPHQTFCKYCGGRVDWAWSPRGGKSYPFDRDGQPHHCAERAASLKVIKMQAEKKEANLGFFRTPKTMLVAKA